VSESPHQQLLVIDTNVALHQIDILEHDCPATGLIVILQTVLQEVRHRNLAVYRRLCNLVKNEKKNYIFFPNEVSQETVCDRVVGETMNDYNDRYDIVYSRYDGCMMAV
jgi:exosome complex exonuclease DIS3/RRP44